MRQAINGTDNEWVRNLRRSVPQPSGQTYKLEEEPGFYSQNSLISTDQGMRGFLQVLNDICYVQAPRLKLNDWILKPAEGPIQDAAITAGLKSIEGQPVAKTVNDIAKGLSSFDWRTSSAPDLSPNERQLKLAFRGSGGYKELRRQLLTHLAQNGPKTVSDSAKKLLAPYTDK